ncbi:LEAF RUST 10 DISEASE-RESISTANCE LOCUS RECEPTOR-LIKE PROTEIN KINASE-like protein 2.1 [Cinnamomum micranthum f. kanehirae]|uniref:LEAF RUST 10 DISEASE-RESISTANCE LOCUS RECEPTOR-LIKE PROTEIN KINASE-like protein 2.1 n=1 Tax=Cinnamomum micranthum f. kanehirae TaxID=337451 RepID=A0A443NU82_9MAGN|nr:LEAF RUST 10 DISEASE-RESISTANCE LOCUS RECEPTOR-LIKE PROTEIN KINASE-like protein 2.1 [Cinnamomum micranthum f. kanehirae]
MTIYFLFLVVVAVFTEPASHNAFAHGDKSKTKIIAGAITGVILTCCFVFILCLVRKLPSDNSIFFWKKKTRDSHNVEAFLENYGSLAPKRYRYSELKTMTNTFKDNLGHGGYGSVFKGNLKDGRPVAVKTEISTPISVAGWEGEAAGLPPPPSIPPSAPTLRRPHLAQVPILCRPHLPRLPHAQITQKPKSERPFSSPLVCVFVSLTIIIPCPSSSQPRLFHHHPVQDRLHAHHLHHSTRNTHSDPQSPSICSLSPAGCRSPPSPSLTRDTSLSVFPVAGRNQHSSKTMKTFTFHYHLADRLC